MNYRDKRMEEMRLRNEITNHINAASESYHAIMRSGIFHCAQTGQDWKNCTDKFNRNLGAMLLALGRVASVVEQIEKLENS